MSRTIIVYANRWGATEETAQEIKEVLNWKGFNLVNYLKEKAKANDQADPSASPPRPKVTPPPETATEDNPQIYLYRGKGCDQCDGNGYSG